MRAANIEIVSINTTNQGGVGVDFRLRSARGKVIGRHVMAWRTKEQLDHFMSLASTQELIRAALRERLKGIS